MDNIEQQLGAILNNPQMMQTIMSMAQTLGQSQQTQSKPSPASPSTSFPQGIDPGIIQKISGFLSGSRVTQEEQNLLHALSPYLSKDRVIKLEKAMRAAKLARAASAFMNAGGLQFLMGR